MGCVCERLRGDRRVVGMRAGRGSSSRARAWGGWDVRLGSTTHEAAKLGESLLVYLFQWSLDDG